MIKIFSSNKFSFSVVLSLLLIVAGLQALVPNLIYQGIENIVGGDEWLIVAQLLFVVIFFKVCVTSLVDSIVGRLEVEIRYSIIEKIIHVDRPSRRGEAITLVKEDADRVSSAAVEIVEIVASLALVVFIFCYLVFVNKYFIFPLVVMLILLVLYLSVVRPGVDRRYCEELEKEETYKGDMSDILLRTEKGCPLDPSHFELCSISLAASVKARLLYERWNHMILFFPEFALASGTAGIIFLAANISTEIFTTKLIVYIGYLGLFNFSVISAVNGCLSLAGASQSIRRIGAYHAVK